MKDRVDERFVTKPRSQTKMFGSEQNLCEDERVNERKRVLLVIQMMLRERGNSLPAAHPIELLDASLRNDPSGLVAQA